VNFSGSVGRINLILFALDSAIQAPSFDYNKPIIRDTLNFDLKGGPGFFQPKFGSSKSNQIYLNFFL
jgi:hypothetical protein